MSDPPENRAEPDRVGPFWGDRAIDAGVLGFAGFTVLAHATVAQGGNAVQLVGAVAIAAAIALAVRIRSGGATPPALPGAGADAEGPTPPWLRTAFVAAAVALAAVFARNDSVEALWRWGAAIVAAGVAAEVLWPRGLRGAAHPLCPSAHPRAPQPRPTAALGIGLTALGVGCALVTLMILRPDADDSFYVNLAVSLADRPGDPLLASDTLHGVAGLPLSLPVYRVHSIELLEGLLAWLTPLHALDVVHLAVPAIAAFLAPFAIARLARLVVPDHWWLVTCLALGFLLCVAETPHGHANFGFPRLQQGKAIALTVVLPLITAYGIEFAAGPGIERWLRLAAAQIAAIGLTASALWLAPVVALVALASQIRPGPAGLARLASGLAASTYPLAAAAFLRHDTLATFADASRPLAIDAQGSLALAYNALHGVLGFGLVLHLATALAIGGFALARSGVLRRLLVLSSAAFLVFWSPFWGDTVAHQITSAATYFRVFWLIPLPLLFAVAIAAPVTLANGQRAVLAGRIATAAIALGVFVFAPRIHTLAPSNFVSLGIARWDLPADAGQAAIAVARLAPPGSHVLAPEAVATWLPTFHRHPHPLVVREGYVPMLVPALGSAEVNRRLRLSNAAAGNARLPRAQQTLATAIDEYPLTVVCMTPDAADWPPFRAALEASPLEPAGVHGGYVLWARPASETQTASERPATRPSARSSAERTQPRRPS